MLMYYDARPCGMSGLFDTDTLAPRKGYYSFLHFKELRRLGTSVKIDSQVETIYSCAATDGKNGAIMLTHYADLDEAPAEMVCLDVKGIVGENGLRAEFYLNDGENDNVLVREEILTGDTAKLYLNMKLFDTYLIKLTAL